MQVVKIVVPCVYTLTIVNLPAGDVDRFFQQKQPIGDTEKSKPYIS